MCTERLRSQVMTLLAVFPPVYIRAGGSVSTCLFDAEQFPRQKQLNYNLKRCIYWVAIVVVLAQ